MTKLYLQNLSFGSVLTIAEETARERSFCLVLFDDEINFCEALLKERDTERRESFTDEQVNSEIVRVVIFDDSRPKFDILVFEGDKTISVSRLDFERILKDRNFRPVDKKRLTIKEGRKRNSTKGYSGTSSNVVSRFISYPSKITETDFEGLKCDIETGLKRNNTSISKLQHFLGDNFSRQDLIY